jgi:hypothetical protein
MQPRLWIRPKFFLTYDNEALMDGVGAQIQRIVSIYGISRKVKIGYVHTGLKDIDPQVFSTSTFQERGEELDRWNQLFRKDLPIFTQLPTDRIINQKRMSLFVLRVIKFVSRFSKKRIVCKMSNPRVISDNYPECLLHVPEMLAETVPKIMASAPKTEFTIVVHIRQGELVLSQFKDRLLPLSHYERILSHIVPILEHADKKYRILIPRENGQGKRISTSDPKVIRSISLDPNNKNLDFTSDGYVNLLHEKPSSELTPILFKATWLSEESTYADFCKMIQADLLITSKSSLSFTAGLFNKESIKVYTPFWHTAPASWINADQLQTPGYLKIFEELLRKSLNSNLSLYG